MSAEDRSRETTAPQAEAVVAALHRPFLAALIEAQPLPALLYGSGGAELVHNAAATTLVTTAADGTERVLVQDGTDLWTIIAARSEEASPFLDLRVRIRLNDGQAPETTVTLAPFRGPGGILAGALVVVLSMPSQRLREAVAGTTSSDEYDFDAVSGLLGELSGAGLVGVLEVDPEFTADAGVLSLWCSDGSTPELPPMGIRGTVFDSFAGRRIVCVPSGLGTAYADDPLIAGGGFEAFLGVALADQTGHQVGLLVGLWREPLDDIPGTSALFLIMAGRVARGLIDMTARRELRESEQRYGSVFEGSAVPILLIEPQTTQIVDANPAACAMYGYPHAEFVTMSILQIDAMNAENVQSELQRALDGSRSNFNARHMLSTGSVRDVEVSIGPIRVGGRQLLYVMVNDVTDRKRMEAELERSRRNLEMMVAQRTEDLLRANAELQQASTARDMVFVNLAQELRTSLQTITGFSDLLATGMAGELNDEQRRQVAMIQQAGKRLTTFASTLMESRRITQRDTVCDAEDFDLVALAESVLFGLEAFAEDKGLLLKLVAEERPVDVTTDRYKLQQILLNLLSNAIRYTERGAVTVTVGRSADGMVSVAVEDTGPGLRPEELATIFDGPEVHDSASGIGLPTNRRVAAMLGGTIEVQSTPGRGSVFTLMVPEVCLEFIVEQEERVDL